MKFETTTTALWWLKAIDVQSSRLAPSWPLAIQSLMGPAAARCPRPVGRRAVRAAWLEHDAAARQGRGQREA